MNSDQASAAFTAPLTDNNSSLDSFITSASIIGGMNPIWSFGGNSDDQQQQLPSNQSLSNRAFGATNDNLLEDESILGLSINPSVLPNFAHNSQQMRQQTPVSFGNESPNQSINNSGSGNNSSNKPIGFERHEKQIHSSGHVNVGSSPLNMVVGGVNGNNGNNGGNGGGGGGFNMNMAIGLQLNNLNLDDFSCKSYYQTGI